MAISDFVIPENLADDFEPAPPPPTEAGVSNVVIPDNLPPEEVNLPPRLSV